MKTKKREEKTLRRHLDMIQKKNTSQLEHSTESLFIDTYLKTLYPFSYTVFLSCLITKLGWKNISLFLLQKNPFEYASHAHSFEV